MLLDTHRQSQKTQATTLVTARFRQRAASVYTTLSGHGLCDKLKHRNIHIQETTTTSNTFGEDVIDPVMHLGLRKEVHFRPQNHVFLFIHWNEHEQHYFFFFFASGDPLDFYTEDGDGQQTQGLHQVVGALATPMCKPLCYEY